MRNYGTIRENLTKARKGLASLKRQMPLEEYLEDRYLVKQGHISSVALACLEEGIDAYLAFELTLDTADRLLLLDLTGER